MKKRTIHADQFLGPELGQFLKHFRHGKYPGERATDKSICHAQRQSVKLMLRGEK